MGEESPASSRCFCFHVNHQSSMHEFGMLALVASSLVDLLLNPGNCSGLLQLEDDVQEPNVLPENDWV